MKSNIKEIHVIAMDKEKFNAANLHNYPMIKAMASYGEKLLRLSEDMGAEFIDQCTVRKAEEFNKGNIPRLTRHKSENLFYSGKTDNHHLILA